MCFSQILTELGAVGSGFVCVLHRKGVTLQRKRQQTTDNRQRMKHTLFIFIMAMALLSLLSCKEDNTEQQLLDSIEQTWRQCEASLPEAQIRAGQMMDSVRKSSEYVRQKYNLLTIRLRDKRDVIPSSPDSAMQTLAYFSNRTNDVDKERAYYYAGSAYRDLKDYPRAVSLFLKAADIAENNQAADTLVWQNSLSQLRYLYMLQLNYEEELKVALQAVELAKQSGKNWGSYLLDAASAYDHLSDTVRCLQYCDQSYMVYREEHFPAKYGGSLAYMLAIYSKYKRYERVDTLLQHLMQLPENQRPHNFELSMAKYHEEENQTDSAILHYMTYYDRAEMPSGRYEASAGLQRCYMQKGDYRQAAQWGCRLHEINDTIIAQRAFEQTQRARDAYIYHRDREEERSIMQRDERIIFVSVITGLALISIIMGLAALYYFRKKKFMEVIIGKDMKLGVAEKEIRRRTNELEQKNREIEQLGSQLDEAERTIAASQIRLESTMKDLEQRVMMNKELTRIALMNNVDENAEKVIEHFRKVATGRTALKEGSWKELIAAIETLYPGFQEKVQGRLKKQLREPLLYTICLLKIGLKPIQIARVMDAKIQTVWNRVKRAEETCGDLLRVV